MNKRKEYYDDYDMDNFAYRDDDDENEDEDDLYALNPTDLKEDDDMEEEEEILDSTDVVGFYDDLDDAPAEFDPSNYDFVKIMEDYQSVDDARKDAAVEQAVQAMDALVKHIINRHYPTYREKYYDDMLQEGRMAIVETLGGYTGKCAPSSYFYTTIRHQIQVYVAENVHRTTRHYAAMANKIRKAELALTQIDGKDYHDDLTISVYTGLPLTTVIETRRQTMAADFVELNPNIDTDDTHDEGSDPVATYWKNARLQAIQDAVNRLQPTEAKVIRLMYGLDGGAPINPPEISRRLHLKTDQVRKISQDACRKLSHDKKLMQDLGTQDRLTAEKEKASVEMPFVSVNFGAGENFFDDISEEEDNDDNGEVLNLFDLLKPMTLEDNE